MGSGSVMTLLLSDNSKAADVYAGLKIPVYQGKPKDRDGDGIVNRKDDCPDEFGPIENNGCPWPDTDGDKVIDKEDKCSEEAGEVLNDGCPLVDSDGDDVLDEDDKCPNQPGAAENQGCPWPDTDGDGVLDKNDQCPNEMGTVANNGCPEAPEVTEEVQKQLNDYAKTILFNSGKASIKAESTSVLVDIMSILKEYPEAKFTVEGHTDSVGSKATNQKLSESRAISVKDFLIEKGIDSSRLTAIGHGEDKPIASNMYKDGRAQNRRVEINLVK
ncbi:OmpA family protein [Zobellia nedashkovskayae]